MNPAFLFKVIRSMVFKRGPLYAHFGITHRCNLQCRMCVIFRDTRRYEELSLGQIEGLFDSLRRLGVIYVSIGGGEPFLREDLSSVVGLLTKKGFKVRVLTNGTLVDERVVKELAVAGLRDISISLDSLDPHKEAYLCNRDGIFEKIIRGMDLCADILPVRRRLLLMNTVVSPLNIQELPQLAQFAQRKGYYISFVPIETHGSSEFTFTQDQHRWIDGSYDYLIEAKKKGKSSIFNSSVFLEKSRRYLKSGERNWRCDAGRLYVSINPCGELSVCHRYVPGIPFAGADLKNIFRSKDFQSQRQRFIRECPGCMRPCWAEVSFLFKHARSLKEMLSLQP